MPRTRFNRRGRRIGGGLPPRTESRRRRRRAPNARPDDENETRDAVPAQVLTATRGLSRRFGLAGGLAIFGILLAVEGDEIVKALGSAEPVAGAGEVVTLQQGLSYTESLVGRAGDAVSLPGAVVGLGIKVSVAFPDSAKVIFDSDEDGKPVAFKYGQRPFQNVLCEGVELGIKGMKAGGRRRLVVPAALAPKGVEVPPGAALVYDVEVKEVLPGYF